MKVEAQIMKGKGTERNHRGQERVFVRYGVEKHKSRSLVDGTRARDRYELPNVVAYNGRCIESNDELT
jgi:hypothetical protein